MATSPVSIRLTAEGKRALGDIERSSRRDIAYARLLQVFGRHGRAASRYIGKDLLSNQVRRRRTGALATSVMSVPEMIEGRPGVAVGFLSGPALPYAGVQEFGTKGKDPESPYPTILPRNKKALAVPVSKKALTGTGAPKYQSATQYPSELSFVPYKQGTNAIGGLYEEKDLARERKRARREKRRPSLRELEAVYVLLRKADVSPGRFLRSGMEHVLPAMTDEIGDELVRLAGGLP